MGLGHEAAKGEEITGKESLGGTNDAGVFGDDVESAAVDRF